MSVAKKMAAAGYPKSTPVTLAVGPTAAREPAVEQQPVASPPKRRRRDEDRQLDLFGGD